MKTVKSPNTYLKYGGKLCEVVGIADSKVLFIREVNAEPCPACGEIKEYAEVEASPNFQDRAEPIDTIIINNS